MGLLDDAIREHLDLQRRRGGDPAEIARSEQEALGPVRREPAPDQVADEHHDAPAVDHPRPHVHEDDQTHDDVPQEVVEAREPHAPDPASVAHDRRPESAAAPSREDSRHSDIVHQPTTEFHVEHDHDEDEPDGPAAVDEDVLEETPDFLQETPEHDRLWFEQRPPRDFDFDG